MIESNNKLVATGTLLFASTNLLVGSNISLFVVNDLFVEANHFLENFKF